MNIFLAILSVFILCVFIINNRIKLKKFEHVTALESIYDKMEMFFIKQNIILTNDYILLLKTYKNLAINTDLLDIKVLIISLAAINEKGTFEKDKSAFIGILNSLSSEFKNLTKEFDIHSNALIKLSLFKFDIIFFVLYSMIKNYLKNGVDTLNKKIYDYSFVKQNEEYIAYSGIKMAGI